jgi:hypothetical protein
LREHDGGSDLDRGSELNRCPDLVDRSACSTKHDD